MSNEIIKVDEWKPGYDKQCENCGADHVVTGWRDGKVVFEGDLCGVCSWGEADMAFPENWNKK